MPAKPQSGRAIELGLALRIVSKRGRQVMFGQTGLLFANRQWVLFYGPNKNTALPVAVSKKIAEFATHCGTATSINAIPDFVNSFRSLTKIGFNSSGGDDESIFLMISLGQV